MVWTDLSLSSDRRTITVTTAYPIEGDVTCAKEPDGISIRLDERQGVAQIDARMRRRAAPSGADCTMECDAVEQTITLDAPLPASITAFEPPADAVAGCRS